MTVLVTGGNGRLARALARRILPSEPVRLAARSAPRALEGADTVEVGPIEGKTDWSHALDGVRCVVHCAALTRLGPDQTDEAYFAVNREGTRVLAEQAVAAGVSRMVLVSSITVNGKHSGAAPFTTDDTPRPGSPYSQSKLDGERALQAVAAASAMEWVIVRPPRIVWDVLDGNLAQLGNLVRRGLPLPFGSLASNARQSVGADALVGGLAATTVAPAAANRILLLADAQPRSTVELLRFIGRSVGRSPRLFPLPRSVLAMVARLAPRRLLGHLDAKAMIEELTRDLRIDSAPSWAALGLQPPALD